MAVARGVNTITFDNGIQIEADLWTDQANPGTPHIADALLETKFVNVADEKRIYMVVKVPTKPDDADESVGYDGIRDDIADALKLTLYHDSRAGAPGADRNIYFWEVLGDIAEDDTWNSQKRTGTLVSSTHLLAADTGSDSHDFDLTDFVKNLGYTWGGTIPVMFRSTDVNLTDLFGSRENGTLSRRPKLAVSYFRKPPTKMDDLKIEPYVGNKAFPRLTWSANEDEDFNDYRVWYKLGASAWTPHGVALITEQGTEEYVMDSYLTENVVTRMRVRVTDIYGGYQDSNEVWFVRPDVSSFTMTGTPPNVKAEVTASVKTATYPTLPTPVVDEKVIMDWTGEGLETGSHNVAIPENPLEDEDGADVGKEYLKHRYFEAVDAPSTITPSVQVENSLGFRSNVMAYASPFSVTSLAPEAKVRALPTKSEAYSIHPTPGTILLTTASKVVGGSGARFLRDVGPNDILIVDGYDRYFVVSDVISDEILRLDVDSPITTTGNEAYMIVKDATVRLMGDESIERNSNGTLDKFEFRSYDAFAGLYYNKTSGQWQVASVYNDQLTVPYIDVPMIDTYHTGTVDAVKGSKVVSGNGTTFNSGNVVHSGDVFMVFGSKPYVIDTVDSDLQITLKDVYDEASGSTVNYHIFRQRSDITVAFQNSCIVTNSFTKTDTVYDLYVYSAPKAGIDMFGALRALGANISLYNPTDGRKKQVIEIPDSDDGEVVDEGRSVTTMRVDGSTMDCDNQDAVETLMRYWLSTNPMIRVFIQKLPGADKSKYYECTMSKLPRTHSQHTYFQWNDTLIILRRVE